MRVYTIKRLLTKGIEEHEVKPMPHVEGGYVTTVLRGETGWTVTNPFLTFYPDTYGENWWNSREGAMAAAVAYKHNRVAALASQCLRWKTLEVK